MTFGDLVRVPTSRGTLAGERAAGADVRVVYSLRDAVRIAAEETLPPGDGGGGGGRLGGRRPLDEVRGEARRIGFVTAAHPGRVALRTRFGTRRVLDMPVGELPPRIC